MSILITILVSCWSEKSKPDTNFMNLVKQQSSLDSILKTKILIYPKKVELGTIQATKKIEGNFWIKNIGGIDFNLVNLWTDCDCCKTEPITQKTICPQDSLNIRYSIDIQNGEKYISHAIVAVGNCQFGNQTYTIQAFINH